MRGILHGTGDKSGEKAPALVDVPGKQASGGDGKRAGKVRVPRKKRAPKLKGRVSP